MKFPRKKSRYPQIRAYGENVMVISEACGKHVTSFFDLSVGPAPL